MGNGRNSKVYEWVLPATQTFMNGYCQQFNSL